MRLAGRLFDAVDLLPAGVEDRVAAPLGEHVNEITRLRRALEPPGRRILEQELHRLGRVLLVGPDHAGRTSLDPAGAVHTGDRLAVLVEHPAAIVQERPTGLVERKAGQRDASIADASKDDPCGDGLATV